MLDLLSVPVSCTFWMSTSYKETQFPTKQFSLQEISHNHIASLLALLKILTFLKKKKMKDDMLITK